MNIKHETNTLLGVVSEEDCSLMYGELRNALNAATSTYKNLKLMQDGEMDEFDVLDELETAWICDYKVTSDFSERASSRFPAITKCLRELVPGKNDYETVIGRYNKICSRLCENALGIEESDVEELLTVLNDLIGKIVFTMRYEFALDKLVNTYEETQSYAEMEILNSFKNYCSKLGMDDEKMLTEARTIIALNEKFKSKVEFFEDYPELEAPFEAVMGPYIADIDTDKLTLELVRQLLTEEITPEILAQLIPADSDCDSTDSMDSFS